MCNFLEVMLNFSPIESYGSGQNTLESGQNTSSCFARPYDEKLHMGLKDVAHLAALRTALQVESGDVEAWPEQIELQLRLAGTLDEEPLVVSHLISESIVRMAVNATQRSLNRATPSAEACKRLQSAFAHAGETNLLPSALVGERAMMIPEFGLNLSQMQTLGENGPPGTHPRPRREYSGRSGYFVWLTGFFERDLDFYLETMEGVMSFAALPPPQSLALTNYMETAGNTGSKTFHPFSGMLLPSLSTIIIREAAFRAQVELATTALAVEHFRHDRQRLPENLEELMPQFVEVVPTDPFDGAALRYRRLESGYVIYSIDADGHDDGGREPPELKKSTDKSSYDMTFMVER